MTREAWAEAQYHKRLLKSWGLALGGVGTVIGVLWIVSLLGVFRLMESPGETLQVRLGSPDGEALPLDVTPLPDPAFGVSSAWEESPPEPQKASVKEPLISETKKKPESKIPPERKTPPEKSPPEVSQPAAVTPPKDGGTPGPNPSSEAPGPTVKVIKGKENGNTMEMVLEGGAGHVGRSLYVPIYLYLPLPKTLDLGLVAKIPETREGYGSSRTKRDLVTQHYRETPGGWILQAQPNFEARPQVWILLQSAGYNLSEASYKKSKVLAPVNLKFTLSAPEPGKPSALINVTLEGSSGDAEVDAGVLYGFRMSAFSNGTGREAQGTFTYDFKNP